MTKNDQAWEILFDEENILAQIEQNGIFYISSARINEQRQARLMAKFDHAVQLPEIFRKNALSIQPVSRSGYVIGHFDSYFNLPRKHLTEVIYSNLPEHIETIDAQNIYSESSAILCAFHSGMISDVIGEEVDITVLSRMSTGIFDYQINNLEKSKNIIVEVKNSQCEIDGGFEGENTFAIIEAKCESVEDFIIRQLYYPYRLWKSKTDKKVIPIFLSISNDIFTFYKFRFLELDVYNSIELVSEHRYCLGSYGISLSDIRDILEEIKIVADFENTPFPQADNFSRIVDLLGQLYTMDEPLSKDDITSIYAFDARQTQYYVSAAIYLGLISKEKVKNHICYLLSSKGQSIMAQHPKNRNLELVKSILSHRIFNLSLQISLEKAEIPSVQKVVSIMNKGAEKISSASITTQKRRAQTVKGWIAWIFELTRI
jgi:hypothetical protein